MLCLPGNLKKGNRVKIFIFGLLLILSCQQQNDKPVVLNQTIKNRATVKQKLKENYSKNSLNNSLNLEEQMFNYLFVIRYYDYFDMPDSSRNLTLVKNNIDTSFYFNFPLRTNKFSSEVEKYAKVNKLQDRHNNITKSLFYLKEVKSIDDTMYLGIFVEYFGFERICYAYGRMKIFDDKYNIDNLYSKLDVIGIGSITYDKLVKLNTSDFYMVGDSKGEAYQSIAIHYFPKDLKNKTYKLAKCIPSAEGEPHDERLDYSVDYKNNTIEINKYEIDNNKEDVWRLVFSKTYNILEIIKKGQK